MSVQRSRAAGAGSLPAAPGGLVHALLLLAAGLAVPGLAAQSPAHPAAPSAQATAASPAKPAPPLPAGAPAQPQIAGECARLFALATDLKAAVDRSSKDQLSVVVVRKAAQVEQLARKVKDEMKPAVDHERGGR